MTRLSVMPASRLCLLLAIALCGGCARIGGGLLSGDDDGAGGATPVDGNTNQIADLGDYLESMRQVIEGDPLIKAETLRRIEEAADIAPTTTNRLMYALVLAVPGHPGSDAEMAQRRLSALLASGNALLPAERMLAAIQLREVEQRLILEVAATELREELAAVSQTSDSQSQQRIQGLIDENQRLQAELDDATSKLNAITSIEQSIRELEDGAD